MALKDLPLRYAHARELQPRRRATSARTLMCGAYTLPRVSPTPQAAIYGYFLDFRLLSQPVPTGEFIKIIHL